MADLRALGADIQIWTDPVEMAERIPFEQDTVHTSYDPEAAHRFWQVLDQFDRVMKIFRSRFK